MKETMLGYVFISILLIMLFATFIISIKDMNDDTNIYEGEVTGIKHKYSNDRYHPRGKYIVNIEKEGKRNSLRVSQVEYKAIKVGMYLVWDNEEGKVKELRE
ncbi:hypothetical protein [Mammaliicoccus virus vB_MscM-PMS2]|nr:hypothetical protein [Mammaliicoccus virus vB_MscM-PMS2]